MSTNSIALDVDLAEAKRSVDAWEDAVDIGASDAVRQLAVLAEGAMKDEAPEGAGRDTHLRDTIDTRFSRGNKKANVGARKRTSEGWLLANVIVEGTDPGSYDDENPPPPLFDWAAAKLGDPSLGWAVAQSIADDGHESFPDPFVDRSLQQWQDQVEDIAADQIEDAIDSIVGGG